MRQYIHTTQLEGNQGAVQWPVDLEAAARAAPWAARQPEVLVRDLDGMAAYFPHWLLVGASGDLPAYCRRCRALLAPTDGALRCIACRRPGNAHGLVWVGHIPSLARPEARFVQRQVALRAAGFPEVKVNGLLYLLAPLTVHYPAEWPDAEPAVRYSLRWLEALGLSQAGAAHHLLPGGRACLFAWGQWTAMPIHTLLQQRVINHIASLLKIAAGMAPARAFIGRIEGRSWAPASIA